MNFLKHHVTIAIMLTGVSHAGTLLTEGFDDVGSIPGWLIVNNSAPVGDLSWFQGNPGIFSSQSGTANAYVAANFLNAAQGGDISTWLISPVLTFNDGDIISFFTRTVTSPAVAPDRLELRLSTSGASINVGSTSASVGEFSQSLLTINPALTSTGYPATWTQFVAMIAGLGGPTSGRFAFRYSVPDTDSNGDYIGVDTVSVSTGIPEPGTVWSAAAGAIVLLGVLRRRPRQDWSTRQ